MAVNFKPVELDEDTLIALFHEKLTTQALAEREGVRYRYLMEQWSRLRKAGKLPPGGHEAQGVQPPHHEPEGNCDGRPSLALEDPLLDMLRTKHPDRDYSGKRFVVTSATEYPAAEKHDDSGSSG